MSATDSSLTDDPTDDTPIAHNGRDPILSWLHHAEVSHERMHRMIDDATTESKWRKECIRMAIAAGASQETVAARLGITREQVSKLAR